MVEQGLEPRPTTRRDPIGLHARQRMLRVSVRIHLVEHGADDVEVAREGRPRAHDEQADAVADVNLERVLLVLERPPVEHDVAGVALERDASYVVFTMIGRYIPCIRCNSTGGVRSE